MNWFRDSLKFSLFWAGILSEKEKTHTMHSYKKRWKLGNIHCISLENCINTNIFIWMFHTYLWIENIWCYECHSFKSKSLQESSRTCLIEMCSCLSDENNSYYQSFWVIMEYVLTNSSYRDCPCQWCSKRSVILCYYQMSLLSLKKMQFICENSNGGSRTGHGLLTSVP